VSIPLPAFLYEKNGPAFKIANIENLKCVEEISLTSEFFGFCRIHCRCEEAMYHSPMKIAAYGPCLSVESLHPENRRLRLLPLGGIPSFLDIKRPGINPGLLSISM